MTIDYKPMTEHGEPLRCDSCESTAPLSGFNWPPGVTPKPEQPQRLLCQFCSSTMASRYTEYPCTDTQGYLRAEVWRAAGAVFNALKHGLES